MTARPASPNCRHDAALIFDGFCAACLMNEAVRSVAVSQSLPPLDARIGELTDSLTIQVPLGTGPATSVFLAHGSAPTRLFRLKTWHARAPADFLTKFGTLQAQLAEWGEPRVPPPLAASVDSAGSPWVLSEFTLGVPIVTRVRSGHLHPDDAIACVNSLIPMIRNAHFRGLVHGAIVPGNVIVMPDSRSIHLLDFGLTSLLRRGPHTLEAEADLAGFSVLAATIREAAEGAGPWPSGEAIGRTGARPPSPLVRIVVPPE